MESSQSMLSPTSLCKENLASIDTDDEQIMVDGYDYDEYIQMLLDRETKCSGLQMQEIFQNFWIQRARLDAIQYIIRTKELLGFGFQTAYTSVTYLDGFLSRRSIDEEKSWAIRLLSMACLSLAAKMDENEVPPLSEFCVEDYYFESSVIQRMELLVLNTLGWKMGSITPFAFIHFFANKFCDNSLPTNAYSRTVDVILYAMRDAKIMCHRPSVIAAAATFIVLDQGLTRDDLQLKIGPLTSTHSFKIESIISCYDLFQEMDIEGFKLIKGIKSPNLSPIQLQNCRGSAASKKRKRLVFNQNDEFGDVPENKGKS